MITVFFKEHTAAVLGEKKRRDVGKEKKVNLDSEDLDQIKQQDTQQLYVFKLSREAHSARPAALWPAAAPPHSQAQEMTSQGRTPTWADCLRLNTPPPTISPIPQSFGSSSV